MFEQVLRDHRLQVGGVTHTASSKYHDEIIILVFPYKIWRAHSDHGFSVHHTKSTLFDPPCPSSG